MAQERDEKWFLKVLNLHCQWDISGKAEKLYHSLLAYNLIYYPLCWEQNSDMNKTYRRWRQICTIVE